MKLNVVVSSVSQAASAAILYLLCAGLITLWPDTVGRFAEGILHTGGRGAMVRFSPGGFLAGLLAVSIGGGLLRLVATLIYNRLVGGPRDHKQWR